jgi:hypothetical protein
MLDDVIAKARPDGQRLQDRFFAEREAIRI